ncbi:MAG: hypothetical protein ACAI25_10590 [Planctomycetota bacterium]
MADDRLRELERRWRESSSVADEVAFLRERLRVGGLTPEQLALAAWLGHEPAVLVVGQPVTAAPEELVHALEGVRITREAVDLEHWLRGLGRWGVATCVIAGQALGRFVLANRPCSPEVDAALAAAVAWLACPCAEHAREARRAGERAMGSIPVGTEHEDRLAMWVAIEGATLPGVTLQDDRPHGEAAGRALGYQSRRAVGVGLVRPEGVRAAVSRALLPRALGAAQP